MHFPCAELDWDVCRTRCCEKCSMDIVCIVSVFRQSAVLVPEMDFIPKQVAEFIFISEQVDANEDSIVQCNTC